jgi:hypothetical protein
MPDTYIGQDAVDNNREVLFEQIVDVIRQVADDDITDGQIIAYVRRKHGECTDDELRSVLVGYLAKDNSSADSFPVPDNDKSRTSERGHQRVLYKTWEALHDSDLSPVERLTFIAILRYCWSKKRCAVWAKTLVEDVGTSERNLTRVLNSLTEKGWIKVEHRNRQKSIYEVLKTELLPPYPKKGK